MTGLQLGTICIKIAGREAGRQVVVVGMDKREGFAIIEGIAVKRRRCNLRHLWPTSRVIKISADAKKPEIIKKLKEVQ